MENAEAALGERLSQHARCEADRNSSLGLSRRFYLDDVREDTVVPSSAGYPASKPSSYE
jgi:hypothetical protein